MVNSRELELESCLGLEEELLFVAPSDEHLRRTHAKKALSLILLVVDDMSVDNDVPTIVSLLSRCALEMLTCRGRACFFQLKGRGPFVDKRRTNN